MPTRPPSDLRIIEADVSQAPLILEFIGKLAEYEKLSAEVVATEDSIRVWLFGERPAAEVLLAYLGERAVGFALFFTTFSTFLTRPGTYLEDLFVDADVRGRGIGKALLARVARLTFERGYGRLEWSVLDWNEPSLAFYRSLGARPLKDWIKQRLEGASLEKLARE